MSERQMTRKEVEQEVERVADPGPCFGDGGLEAHLEHKHRDCAHRSGVERVTVPALPCVRRTSFLCSAWPLVSAEPGIWSLSRLQPQC